MSTSPCQLFAGCVNADGYGQVRRGGVTRLAHRLAYCTHHNVPIASIAGKVVRHTCDTPRCVNPHHLLLGTQADNMQDAVNRNRQSNPPVLTMQQAREIRARIRTGIRGVSNPNGDSGLALEYGVTRGTIRQIVAGLTYKEV